MATPLAAVVLCAGKGTRMKSDLPKVLHPLLGVPLCTYPLRRALALGAHPVVPVVGHQAQAVETAVRALFPEAPLSFALQSEQRGTAHAVGCAKEALAGFQGRVLILYGDTPLLRQETLAALLQAHERAGGPLAMMTMVADNPQGYGRVLREGGRVVGVVEQKDCTPEQAQVKECNAGIYSVDASFLWRALAEVKPQNAQGEYYLTDIVALASREGEVATLTADMAETAGVNDRVDLAQCTRVLQQRINTRLMREGVSMVDPTSAWIAEDVRFGTDCTVGPQVSVGPGCEVGSRVTLEQGCVLTRSRVGEGTHLKPYSVLEEAQVGTDCHVGPFARLRPGTELAEGVHIGNFVETKKARLGRGSKANHLAYLGDARIGSGVNVGAGTITCNYDGVSKHETVLGDGVFIGSDTQLVAPVTVGAGAYVGAGSTVTKDVPPGALAVSRTPQSNVEGWAEKKRARQQAERQRKVRAGGGGEPSR